MSNITALQPGSHPQSIVGLLNGQNTTELPLVGEDGKLVMVYCNISEANTGTTNYIHNITLH